MSITRTTSSNCINTINNHSDDLVRHEVRIDLLEQDIANLSEFCKSLAETTCTNLSKKEGSIRDDQRKALFGILRDLGVTSNERNNDHNPVVRLLRRLLSTDHVRLASEYKAHKLLTMLGAE